MDLETFNVIKTKFRFPQILTDKLTQEIPGWAITCEPSQAGSHALMLLSLQNNIGCNYVTL